MAYDADELQALYDLGYALYQAGALTDARFLWEGVSQIDPGAETAFRLLGLIARDEGRHEDAIALARAAFEREPTPAAALIRAEAWLATGRFGEALRDLERLALAPPVADGLTPLRDRAAALLARLRRPAQTRP